MAHVNPVKSRRKVLKPIFHKQTKQEDDNQLSRQLINNARKTGQLNLSNRNLYTVPEGLWSIYESGRHEVDYDFKRSNDEGPWWNYRSLKNLDLSSNCLKEIPARIQIYEDLNVLNLQDNILTDMPDEISKLTKLIKLNLSRNKLSNVPNGVYHLTDLQTLVLSHNTIEEIDSKIGDLVMLQLLDLSHNQLTELPIGLGYLVRLTEINLSHNKLTNLPPDIVNLRVLLKLDVNHNELTSLPALGELRKLQILYAQHNNIAEIPDFEGCESLHELYLGNNYVAEVPKEFCLCMHHLKTLDLRDNKIESLPEEVQVMQQLVRLDLTNNDLPTLPGSLALLPHLQNLQVEGNKLRSLRRDILQGGTGRILKYLRGKLHAEMTHSTVEHAAFNDDHIFPDKYAMMTARGLNLGNQQVTDVPESVFRDAKDADITSVDLSKNKLVEVPKGIHLVANTINELNLSSNQLISLAECISQCIHLQFLDVSNNHLDSIPDSFSSLRSLRELIISNNRFESIPDCVYELKALENLLARDNHIGDVNVGGFLNLRRLAVLDLSNNDISHVPPELGNMTQLRVLELAGNSFRQPRCAILAKGTDAILSYLRDRIPS